MRHIYIFLIGLISTYDNCMSVIYRESLMDMEQNAIGRFLLKQGLDVFVEAKAVGTFLSIALCYYISKTKYKMAIPAVCFFQLALFFYLSFDTIFTGWRLPNQFSDYPVQAFISMQMNR